MLAPPRGLALPPTGNPGFAPADPLPRGQTDTCEIITLPQTSFAYGNKLSYWRWIQVIVKPLVSNLRSTDNRVITCIRYLYLARKSLSLSNSTIHKAACLMVHGRFTGLPGIIPKISKEAAVQNALQGPFCTAAGCTAAL